MTSNTLFLDIETYSETDIKSAGLYKYVEDPAFEILLIQYACGDDPVRVLDLTSDACNSCELRHVLDMIQDPKIEKVAHNAAFERTCFSKYLQHYTPTAEWTDTMILASYNGLPASLEACGAALNLKDQKIKEGTSLINYFCKPCKPTKANGNRTRNLPEHDPEKWERFKKYGRRDVEVEREIYRVLHRAPITTAEHRARWLDAEIVERGVMIDTELVAAAIAVDEEARGKAYAEMQRLTGLENPNSHAQLKEWLLGAGIEATSLNKKALPELIAGVTDPTVLRVLELHKLLGKTSTKKYQAMEAAVCRDNRVRGLLQYYGARTGRWSGRLVQVQNLPQNHLDDLDAVRDIVKSRDTDSLEALFDNVPDTLSQLIRTAFIAKPGHTFLVADYHAIEAVCIAYLAQEEWRLDVFKTHGKIYEASYSQAFGVPLESVKKGSPERQKGKIMELALGYGGGPSALIAFGADKLGLTAEQMEEIVQKWRKASPKICGLWRECETAAKKAIDFPGIPQKLRCGAAYIAGSHCLRLVLPSKRAMAYWDARIDEDGSLSFMSQNQTTKKWERTGTWGGRLVENLVQAYARDILAEAMLRLDAAGYPIVFTVHDEIITEMPEGSRWEDQAAIMAEPVDWAPGLDEILHADGYETPFYKKD